MGLTRRDGSGGSFSVAIRPLVKTSPEEAGFGELDLADGTRVAVLANILWPSHDRNAVAAVKKLLATKRYQLVVLLGPILHEEAFKQVVDEAEGNEDVRGLTGCGSIPEICQVRDKYAGVEERFLALARLGGEFIADFAKVSGAHVIYIGSVTGIMPNEKDIESFVRAQKARLDKYAEKHPEEAVAGPDIPKDWAQFLGLSGNKDVTVMPFGSALRINGVRFAVTDYRQRHPGSASYTDVEHTGESSVRGFDGKVSSAWWTTPKHSLGGSHRRWWQAHEVGNLFDLSQGLGYLRNYDRRAEGIWVGKIVGGEVFGGSIPFLRGVDGRRGIVVDGQSYDEDTPGGYGKKIALDIPSLAKPVKTAAQPTSKAEPATVRQRSTRRRTGSKKTS